jgi:hypothetical protein
MEYRCAISIAALAAIAVLAGVPEQAWTAMPSVCLSRNLFGLECFGCGMTRALAAAAHGRIADAMTLNAGVVVVAPAIVIAALQGIRRRR